MLNREGFINEINSIRALLSENNIMDAYDKMISLNEYDKEIDDYTCYFSHSLDIDYDLIKGATEEQLEEGIIVVEGILGGYIVAQAHDIEETINDIEKDFL